MAENLVTYCVVHQPRRIKLPAQVIPQGTKPADMAPYLFDDAMNRRYFEKVARWCYYPACQMFLDMLDEGYKLGLGFSVSFLWQLSRWDSQLAERFRQLVAHPNCELVGVEPYHSFAFAIDIKLFQTEMKRGKDFAEEFFDKEIRVTDTTEMVMNNEIYYALAASPATGPACSTAASGCSTGASPPISTATASATSASSAATTSSPTTSAIASATRPGRDIPSAPTPTPSICAAPGATSSSSAGTSRRSASTTTSTRASSTSCGRCPPSSSEQGVRCLTPSEAVDEFGNGVAARSAAARVRHHLGRLRGHGVLPGQRLAAGDLPADALGAPQGPSDR